MGSDLIFDLAAQLGVPGLIAAVVIWATNQRSDDLKLILSARLEDLESARSDRDYWQSQAVHWRSIALNCVDDEQPE